MNRQRRGPNNTITPQPSKPFGLAATAQRTNAPSMNKPGMRSSNPPKETMSQEMAEYDHPELDYE